MRTKVAWTLVVVGALCLVISAVIGSLEERPPSPRIRFAYQDRVGSAICVVAVEKGFFKDAGLEVAATRFDNGAACAEALLSGAVDIASLGDTAVVIATAKGPEVKIIASHSAGENRHRIMAPADSPLKRPEDLKGKRLAVRKGTSAHGGLLMLLDANKLKPGDLRIVDMAPAKMPEALAKGTVDAFVASEPTPSLAEACGARELTTLGGMGNDYPMLILARADLLKRHPGDVRRFIRALRRAERFLQRRPREAGALLARATGLPLETTRRAVSRHVYRLALDDSVLEGLNRTARFLHEQGVIQDLPTPASVEAWHVEDR